MEEETILVAIHITSFKSEVPYKNLWARTSEVLNFKTKLRKKVILKTNIKFKRKQKKDTSKGEAWLSMYLSNLTF